MNRKQRRKEGQKDRVQKEDCENRAEKSRCDKKRREKEERGRGKIDFPSPPHNVRHTEV